MSEDNSASIPPISNIDPNKIVEDVTSKVSASYDEKLKEIEAGVEEKTTQLAEEKISKLKQELLNNLAGKKEPKWEWEKKGRKDPENWDQLLSEADRIAEEKFNQKMEEWQAKQKETSQKTEQQRTEEVNQRRNKFSKEWYELVTSGKMVSPAPEIMEKLKKGEMISEEEARKDRGITEYRKLVKSALDNNDESLKLTYYERYNKEPAGMSAPVFGSDGITGSSYQEEPYSYEDIHNS